MPLLLLPRVGAGRARAAGGVELAVELAVGHAAEAQQEALPEAAAGEDAAQAEPCEVTLWHQDRPRAAAGVAESEKRRGRGLSRHDARHQRSDRVV
mmetsp:Transcript_21686/g.55831  ORF Transcript_21686/g.55831 Transcript_21686/m.55831 type:complete len:96 (-) Transcript_21686:51-338(-)